MTTNMLVKRLERIAEVLLEGEDRVDVKTAIWLIKEQQKAMYSARRSCAAIQARLVSAEDLMVWGS